MSVLLVWDTSHQVQNMASALIFRLGVLMVVFFTESPKVQSRRISLPNGFES
jgi:hypothetical protein